MFKLFDSKSSAIFFQGLGLGGGGGMKSNIVAIFSSLKK